MKRKKTPVMRLDGPTVVDRRKWSRWPLLIFKKHMEEIARALAKDEWLEKEFQAKLSCAKTQHGSHIDSLPKQTPTAAVSIFRETGIVALSLEDPQNLHETLDEILKG